MQQPVSSLTGPAPSPAATLMCGFCFEAIDRDAATSRPRCGVYLAYRGRASRRTHSRARLVVRCSRRGTFVLVHEPNTRRPSACIRRCLRTHSRGQLHPVLAHHVHSLLQPRSKRLPDMLRSIRPRKLFFPLAYHAHTRATALHLCQIHASKCASRRYYTLVHCSAARPQPQRLRLAAPAARRRRDHGHKFCPPALARCPCW